MCQWGTFDAANYGDRLFPLIAKEELTTRLPGLELTCHAPIGDATLPPGSPPLFPLVPGGGSLHRQRREYFTRHFDAILIGGGDLLRFDRSEPGYGNSEHEGSLRPYDAFLDFLWAESEPNILWNAPGVPFPFEPSRRLLVQLARSHVRYAAVRDEVSRGYLLEAGVEEPVHVYPDTGILLAEIVRQLVDEETVHDLLKERGARLDGRGLLCFQCAPGFLRAEEEMVAKSLARIAARRNLEIVLLPIGLCHGDQDALRLVHRASGNRFTLVENLESPLEIGALIGACDYFVGSSLHGNLTALSFGIPHIVVNNPLRSAKLEGLVQLARLEEFRITGWEDLEDGFDRLAAAPRGRWATAGDRLKARASEHFDQLADQILRAATDRRKPDGMAHTARPRRAGTGNPPRGVRHDSRGARAAGRREGRAARGGRGVAKQAPPAAVALRSADQAPRSSDRPLQNARRRARDPVAKTRGSEREPEQRSPRHGGVQDLAVVRPLPEIARKDKRSDETEIRECERERRHAIRVKGRRIW